ncbi:hypothetical protein KAW18_13020 [candidate division WOR-3 bacterium]|nr:hypothetical protein [candidate division WOR-3 bacterium]
MRKVFLIVLLIGAVSLFAQIPVGTKSIGVTAAIGDLMADDFFWSVNASGGYFFMDGVEFVAGLGVDGSTYEDSEVDFGFTAGAYYHLPMGEALGFVAGAMFGYSSYGDGYMFIPIDAGIEYFLSENVTIRAFNRFTLNLKEGYDNTDHIYVGTYTYF